MSNLNFWVRASRPVLVVLVLSMMVSCGFVRGSSRGGGSGTLTVNGAPASVGGTFVADGDETEHRRKGANATVQWAEARDANDPHSETVEVEFDRTTNQIVQLTMGSSDGFVFAVWSCGGPAYGKFIACSGATLDRTGGILRLANTALSVGAGTGSTSQITLNGTLTFKPF